MLQSFLLLISLPVALLSCDQPLNLTSLHHIANLSESQCAFVVAELPTHPQHSRPHPWEPT